MFEALNDFIYETVTKENNISLTRENTASLLSGNVEYLEENDTLLMIEADVKKHRKIEG